MKEKTKKTPFMDQEKSEWHPAEIRRRDIQKLLENTKKLAETYGSFLEIKKEGWEKMLESKRRDLERKIKEQNG
tara:strand:- start:28 stop:249 length:222 start_codon:yes stop_codon:yes gene_type:complete